MAGLTDKQKQLDIDKDGEIEASDLKALRTGNTTTKEGRMREKISKLVELIASIKTASFSGRISEYFAIKKN